MVNMAWQAGLDMYGQIDPTFTVGTATQTIQTGGGYNDLGIWEDGVETATSHQVTVQPLSDKEINTLEIGAERIEDYRKIYINDGTMGQIDPSGIWSLPDINGSFKAIKTDNRPTRNYCKIIAVRQDL